MEVMSRCLADFKGACKLILLSSPVALRQLFATGHFAY